MPENRHTIIIFIIITTLFILLLIAFIVFILFLYQRRYIDYQKNMETLKTDFEKTLLSSELEIKEQAFQDISREIHDNIGLTLTMAKLNLNTIDWDRQQNPREQVTNSIEFISKAINDLSQLSKALHTDYIKEQGLLVTLDAEIKKIEQAGIIRFDYDVEGNPVYMDNQKELVIFRVVQEVLNNSIKHAHATDMKVMLRYENRYLTIELADNGKGFDMQEKQHATKQGTGLLNITKRALLINGNCEVHSLPGHGTSVKLVIPY